MISLLWRLQKGGSFKGRIAAREVAMDELWGIIYVFFFYILTGLHFYLYERKERVLLYFIVGRIEGSFF